MMDKQETEELAENHWVFIDGLLLSDGANPEELTLVKYLYIQAFIHGFGHGQEHE